MAFIDPPPDALLSAGSLIILYSIIVTGVD